MFPEISFVSFLILLVAQGLSGSKNDTKLLVATNRSKANPGSVTYAVGETLELFCYLNADKENATYNLTWLMPDDLQNRYASKPKTEGLNATLTLEHLQESDSGAYICEALSDHPKDILKQSLQVFVKTRRDPCEKMFVCRPSKCIARRYECDGYPDCDNKADEAPEHCGNNPCEGKIQCEKRCIPASACCQPFSSNCSTKVLPDCCGRLNKGMDYINHHDTVYYPNPQHHSDMNFLQTTIYTVIGCAMVFMMIVTIFVVAICRVQMRRTLLSTFPHRQHALNTTAYHRTFTQEMGVCDVDVYLNRGEVVGGGGVLVTYNINNGVQILSEAVEPPPYSEVVPSPPKEGPPPPYSPLPPDESRSLESTSGRRVPEPRPLTRGLSNVSSEPTLSTLR